MPPQKAFDDPRDVLVPVLSRLPGPVVRVLERSERARSAARDLVALVQGVVGPARPTARRYARSDHSAPVPGELRLRVLSVAHEADDAVTLSLERPAGFSFEAGQFLTLVLPVGGRELRRSYSLCSDPEDGSSLRVTVKRVHGGLGSGYVHDHVRAGSVLRVRGPSGNFTLPSPLPRRVVLLGGGSGATPLLSLAKVAARGGAEVVFVLASRTASAAFFKDELGALAAAGSVRVLHVVEDDDGTLPGARKGRVDLAVLRDAVGDPTGAKVFLCGPEPMMEAVSRDLAALGVADEDLLRERFVSVRETTVELPKHPVRLTLAGRTIEVAPGKTLLEAATLAGADVDFSCTMGGCGACKARLVAGEVVLDEPNCLRRDEREAGMILTCVARPKTDVTIERLR